LEFKDDDNTDLKLFSFDKDTLSSDLIGKTNAISLRKYPEGHTTEVLKQYSEEGEETGTLEIKINRLKQAVKKETVEEEKAEEKPFVMSKESLDMISKVNEGEYDKDEMDYTD
jgi:hypothetical protein